MRLQTMGAVLLDSLPYLVLAIATIMLCYGYAFADGTDYASPAKDDVDQTFGEHSTVLHFVYLAEVIGVGFAWVMTKNPKVLISIPVLLLVTHYGYKAIAG